MSKYQSNGTGGTREESLMILLGLVLVSPAVALVVGGTEAAWGALEIMGAVLLYITFVAVVVFGRVLQLIMSLLAIPLIYGLFLLFVQTVAVFGWLLGLWEQSAVGEAIGFFWIFD